MNFLDKNFVLGDILEFFNSSEINVEESVKPLQRVTTVAIWTYGFVSEVCRYLAEFSRSALAHSFGSFLKSTADHRHRRDGATLSIHTRKQHYPWDTTLSNLIKTCWKSMTWWNNRFRWLYMQTLTPLTLANPTVASCREGLYKQRVQNTENKVMSLTALLNRFQENDSHYRFQNKLHSIIVVPLNSYFQTVNIFGSHQL